jgi:hypothetical protein
MIPNVISYFMTVSQISNLNQNKLPTTYNFSTENCIKLKVMTNYSQDWMFLECNEVPVPHTQKINTKS